MVPGVYFNAKELKFAFVDDTTGSLPTDGEYRKVPELTLFVVAPLVGLVYAVFLPALSFAMIGVAAAKRVAGSLHRSLDHKEAM